MQKSLDSLFEQIGGALASAVFGAKGGGATGSVASVASSFAAPVGAGRSAVPAVGNLGSYAKAIQAIESGGNYGALGPITRSGDRAYGAYQMMGNNIGPIRPRKRLLARGFLRSSSWATSRPRTPSSTIVSVDTQAGMARLALRKHGSAGRGLLVRAAWEPIFSALPATNTSRSSIRNWRKWVKTAEGAVGGLGKLDFGLNAITQNFGAGKGLGGIAGGFDWGSLFSPSWKPNTTLSNVINSVPGFAKGHRVCPRRIGDRRREWAASDVNLPRGSQVTPNHRRNAPRAPRLNGRPAPASSNSQPGASLVNVSGASGDDHIRTLVKQGVGEGLGQYNKSQERGGFGTLQMRYNSQKG